MNLAPPQKMLTCFNDMADTCAQQMLCHKSVGDESSSQDAR